METIRQSPHLEKPFSPGFRPSNCLSLKPRRKRTGDTAAVKATVLIRSSNKSWVVGGNFDLNPQQKWSAAEGFKRSDLAVYLSGNFTSYSRGIRAPAKEPPPGASDWLKRSCWRPMLRIKTEPSSRRISGGLGCGGESIDSGAIRHAGKR